MQELLELEENIRYCLQVEEPNNELCDLSKIEVKVNEIDDKLNFQHLSHNNETFGIFIILKNEKYIHSWIYKKIFLPVNECMEY